MPAPYSYQMPGAGFQAQPIPQPIQATQPQMFQQQPNMVSQPGLSVISITDDQVPNNYPVASGNTVLFVNFNTNRMCFKSTNQNGVPMALRWATFTYDETQQQAQNFQMQNQNPQDSVSRQEFDELKAMLAQALAVPNQDQQQFTSQQAYQQRKYGKRGNRNDGSANATADNG
jgi:hypothetical protein